MKILLTIIISFTIFLTSSAQNVTSVDLTKSKFKETNAEEIFKDVKIISLETHKDGLIEKHCTYYLTDKYIIAVGFLQRAYMFDRETGAFIREVSSLGQVLTNILALFIINVASMKKWDSICKYWGVYIKMVEMY